MKIHYMAKIKDKQEVANWVDNDMGGMTRYMTPQN